MDLIPCELCNDLINVDSYNQHINRHENYHSDIESLIRFSQRSNRGRGRGRRRISNGILRNFIRDNLHYIIDENADNYEYNLDLCDAMGKVEIGISDIELVSDQKFIIGEQESATCPICIEMLIDQKNKKIQLRKLKCNHIFCHKCINKWLSTSKKCPVCNINLENFLLQ